MKSALWNLWSVFRRGFIAYIGAKLIVMPVFLYFSILEMRYRGRLKGDGWELVMPLLLLSTPFWAAFLSRSMFRSRHFDRFRRELSGEAPAQAKVSAVGL